jgi:glycosyltransferase involved in cell wall biosynthesis
MEWSPENILGEQSGSSICRNYRDSAVATISSDIRLLHIHSGNLYGGVETLLKTIADCRLLCPEMESEFALCFDGRIAAELRQAGAVVHILGEVRARNPFQINRARRRLIHILKAAEYDAAVCHMVWPLAMFAPAVRHTRIPLVFWMHDAALSRNWLHLWARFATPDFTLCNSRFTASTLSCLFPNVPSETIHYPVASGQLASNRLERDTIRAHLGASSEAVVIMQASRLEAWKGHLLLLEALGQLRDVPRWVCWIAGGAQRAEEISYEKTLRNKVMELGLDTRVYFLGQRTDVTRLMAAADIYCQPNLSAEPFGIAFIEAMQAGLPVIGTAAGGPLEIVDESCGLLVAPNDGWALATALAKLINDDDERHRLRSGSVRRAADLCDPHEQLRHLHASILQRLRPACTSVVPHLARPGYSNK